MKKIFMYAIAAVAIASGALVGAKNLDSRDNLTETQLENIAALSDDGEQPTGQVICNNFNGYRRILDGKEKIYDCCFEDQVGKGKEDCKRW